MPEDELQDAQRLPSPAPGDRRLPVGTELLQFLKSRPHERLVGLPEKLVKKLQRSLPDTDEIRDLTGPFSPEELLHLLDEVRGVTREPGSPRTEWYVELVTDIDVLDYTLFLIREHADQLVATRRRAPNVVIVVTGLLRQLLPICESLPTTYEPAKQASRQLYLGPTPPDPEAIDKVVRLLTTARQLIMTRPTVLDRPVLIFGQDPDGPPKWRDPRRASAIAPMERSVAKATPMGELRYVAPSRSETPDLTGSGEDTLNGSPPTAGPLHPIVELLEPPPDRLNASLAHVSMLALLQADQRVLTGAQIQTLGISKARSGEDAVRASYHAILRTWPVAKGWIRSQKAHRGRDALLRLLDAPKSSGTTNRQ